MILKVILTYLFLVLSLVSFSHRTESIGFKKKTNRLTACYKEYLSNLNRLVEDNSQKTFIDVKNKFISYCYKYEKDSSFYNTSLLTYISRYKYRPYFDVSDLRIKFITKVYETDDYRCQMIRYATKEIIYYNKKKPDIFSVKKELNIIFGNKKGYLKNYLVDPNGILTNRNYYFMWIKLYYIMIFRVSRYHVKL